MWDDTSTAMDWYCRITCENQTNNVHKCCFKYASSNQSKRAEDEYILKEIPPLNYILFAFSPQYMTPPLDF